MTIVVPTDFSSCSQMAVQYATSFAQQVQAQLLLLHILPDFGPSMGTLPTSHLKEEAIEIATEDLKKLEAEIELKGIAVTYHIAHGADVDDGLKGFMEHHNADLIVIGSHGTSGIKKVLLGSNTVDVINQSAIPVIVVPEQSTVEKITHILYASDLKNAAEETKLLLPLARLLNASIKIIHVPPPQYFDQLNGQAILAGIKEETGYANIEVELLKADNVQAAIEQYAVATHSDLLAMFTHRVGFLEQLFSNSLTREIIRQCKTPLLVINKK